MNGPRRIRLCPAFIPIVCAKFTPITHTHIRSYAAFLALTRGRLQRATLLLSFYPGILRAMNVTDPSSWAFNDLLLGGITLLVDLFIMIRV